MTDPTAGAGTRTIIPITPVPGGPAAGGGRSLYEKRRKVQPRSVQGWFASWRWAMVWLTQAVFYGLPWLPWGGRQAVLFDLTARRFYVFDLVLLPQDFIYLTGLLVLAAYALFFFTTVAGRLWCGYACPQTVYTSIFLWLEKRFEGERTARLRLDASPWTFEKAWRRGGKHAAWIAVALWTGFSFVGYFTPIRMLAAEALALQLGPWQVFWTGFYAFATYGNAGFMREQVCKYMCPYARFQSAMFDRDTLIVSYDAQRGDPRGKRARGADLRSAGLGSCIDCGLCVAVCPTGIDIRHGLQNDCIACSACIDACDGVMDKMDYARGLIRYSTGNALAQGWDRQQIVRRLLRPKVLAYAAVLVLATLGFVASLALRPPVRIDVVRDRAVLARMADDGRLENVYRLQLMNATEAPQHWRLGVSGLAGAALEAPVELELRPAEARWVTVAVRLGPEATATTGPGAHELHFDLTRANALERAASEKSTFVIPR